MLPYLVLILAIGGLFYLAIPGVGAFLVRGQWRVFRRRLLEVSHFPRANPGAWRREKTSFLGNFRFFGSLEAIQGDDRIWITNGVFSVAADLRHAKVYIIPASTPESEGELRVVPWSEISSLPQGSPVLAGGALFLEEGRAVFRSADRAIGGKTGDEQPPLVVIYDCKREQIVQKATWSGRQKNEYWNQFTVPSVLAGSFLLLVLAYVFLAGTNLRFPAITALTFALAPLAPFLPPAFALYFLYRSFWKKARIMRAQRDVAQLPLRYFPVGGQEDGRHERATLLPDLDTYVMVRGTLDTEGGAILNEDRRITLPPNIKRVDISLPRRRMARLFRPDEVCAFGSYHEEGDAPELSAPEDPMAELMLFPGDPVRISRECRRIDRRYMVASSLAIGAAFLLGMAGFFLLLTRLIS